MSRVPSSHIFKASRLSHLVECERKNVNTLHIRVIQLLHVAQLKLFVELELSN